MVGVDWWITAAGVRSILGLAVVTLCEVKQDVISEDLWGVQT